jgi:hypothetical protein
MQEPAMPTLSPSAHRETQPDGSRILAGLGRYVHRARWLVFFSLLAAAFIWLWKDRLEDRVFPRNWGVVIPGQLYRSGQLSEPLLESTLREHKIDLVVDLNQLPPTASADQHAEIAITNRLGVRHVRCELLGDGTGDPSSYIEALALIHEARRRGHRVLVHCTSGAQRAGGVVAIYQMLFLGADANEARDLMTKHGWRPNRDHAVVDYVDAHLPEIADALVARGVLASRPAQLPRLSR